MHHNGIRITNGVERHWEIADNNIPNKQVIYARRLSIFDVVFLGIKILATIYDLINMLLDNYIAILDYYECSAGVGLQLCVCVNINKFFHSCETLDYWLHCGPVMPYGYTDLQISGNIGWCKTQHKTYLLTYHHRCSVAFTWRWIHKKWSWT